MYEYLKKLDFKPNTVLDLGAWNGIWTRTCKEFWPEAHYTCIEAGAKHKERLQKCANEVYIAVLGNKPQKVNMHLRQIRENKITYTKGSNLFGDAPAFVNLDSRDMVTLDSLVGVGALYDFIKLDVQGAEILIMKGAPEIFKRATYIVCEVNLLKDPNYFIIPDVKEMDTYMQGLGFNHNEVIETHKNQEQIDKIYWK